MDVKQQILESYERLLCKKDGDKITVKDIVEDCGISRQAFYYHFHDIQDVLECAFQKKMERVAVRCRAVNDMEEALDIILSELWLNRKYLECLRDSKSMFLIENALIEIFQDFLKHLINDYSEHTTLKLSDLNDLVDFYACGITTTMIRKCDAKEFDTAQYAHTLHLMLCGKMVLFEEEQ